MNPTTWVRRIRGSDCSPSVKYAQLEKEEVPCVLCNSNHHHKLFVGDRYGMGIRTVNCGQCGLVYVNPRPTESEMDRFYAACYRPFYENTDTPNEAYIERFGFREKARVVIDHIDRAIRERLRETHPLCVLDIGCSEGSVLKEFRERIGNNVALYGIEPSETFSALLAGILVQRFSQ